MSKTVIDYVEEANEVYRQDVLAMTKEQIMMECFRTVIWDEVVDYFNNYHDDSDSEEVLALFATHNVVAEMWERLMRDYEIPTTETIHETYRYVIDAHTKNLNPETK